MGATQRNYNEMRKVVLGLGFWVQGLRCFPWMGVSFFLKDTLKMNPSAMQILQNSATLPMVAKPIYGLISDSLYLSGQHRLPYIAIGGALIAILFWTNSFVTEPELYNGRCLDSITWNNIHALLQAVSWIAIASLSLTNISFPAVTLYLLLGNLGASIVEVANDAIVAETGKQSATSSSSSSDLPSFVWMASSVGGIIGNLVGGVAIDKFTPQTMFYFFGFILTIQFLITIFIRENSLNLPKNTSSVGFKKQISELSIALKKPEIARSITWFAASYALIPSLIGTMFFYQTQNLKIDSSVLGISKVFGQASMFLWGVIYNRYLKSVSPRKLISAIQTTMAVLMVSDALFVRGVYREMGVPDSLYVVVFSSVLEVLYFFKILPFSVLIAKLCPQGCEGSVMAFLMSSISFAFIISGYFGVALASFVGATGDDFSGLSRGLLIQAVFTLLPLYWSSCVPDEKHKTKKKEN